MVSTTATAAPSIASTKYRDVARGFTISIPPRWQVIPQNKRTRQALIAKLRKQGHRALANQLAAFDQPWPKFRVFDAVEWPPYATPIATDVIVVKRPLSPSDDRSPAGLRSVANIVFGSLKQERGVRMGSKRAARVQLEGSLSYLIYGSSPAEGFSGRRTGFALYLLMGRQALWQVEFRTDARFFDQHGNLFRRIAGTFRMI
jgi:hypothetical protein